MVIKFDKTIDDALKSIGFEEGSKHYEWIAYDKDEPANPRSTGANFAPIVVLCDSIQEEIIGIINKSYKDRLEEPFEFDINKPVLGELIWFLTSATYNTFYYAPHCAPHKYHLWTGNNNFVIGVEQREKGFNVKEVFEKKIKHVAGEGFKAYNAAKSDVFFDNPNDAKIVYMEYKFDNK